MVEYTPGPWSVGHTRQSTTDPRIGPFWETAIHVGESRNRGNALAIAYLGGNGATNGSREAVEANARLIAAAPDLLAACVKAHGLLLHTDEQYTTEDDFRELGKQLFQAIAKATGAAT